MNANVRYYLLYFLFFCIYILVDFFFSILFSFHFFCFVRVIVVVELGDGGGLGRLRVVEW